MRLLFWKRTEEEIVRKQIRETFAKVVKNGRKLHLSDSSVGNFSSSLLVLAELTTLYDNLKYNNSFILLCESKGIDGYAMLEEEFFYAKKKYFKQF
ncbi:MAG: hypothetical protein SNG49_04795 [Rikenellaceae bacterium]